MSEHAEAAVRAARAAREFDEAIRDGRLPLLAFAAKLDGREVFARFRATLDAFAALDERERAGEANGRSDG